MTLLLSRRRRPARLTAPRLTALEDRRVPTVYNVTSNLDAGPNTLRQAILDANLNLGPDTITFSIGTGPATIALLSPLDPITEAVVIDGTTQPGAAGQPIVELDGTGAVSTGDVHGLRINASDTTVRGLVINRFKNDGMQIFGPVSKVTVAGCYIGTNLAGAAAAANAGTGIAMFDTLGTPSVVTIGGATAADRNVISGNGGQGVYVGPGTTGLTVQNNLIGLDAGGTIDLGNNGSGVLMSPPGAISITILKNVVSGNGGDGVAMDGAIDVSIKGNLFGLSADGKTGIANSFSGVAGFNGSSSITIGGPAAADRNVLSGNGTGVYLGNAISQNNIVEGNYIGTDPTGLVAVPNTFRGLWLNGSANNTVRNNVIAATKGTNNPQEGVVIDQASGVGNKILGNLIGLGADGKTVLANESFGVILFGGANANFIGGAATGERNVIAGNNNSGIALFDTGVVANSILGNFIGVAADGVTAAGNQGAGVFIGNSASNTTIGGINLGEGNLIANNKTAGVAIESTSSGNLIRANRILNNGALGIDLNNDGVTLNDTLDPDPGANTLLNFPVITSLTTGGSTSVGGSYNGLANTILDLDFYANAAADPSGFGEGARFIGSVQITTDGSGDAIFNAIGLSATTAGEVVTAIANNPSAQTSSEFSKAFPAAAPPTVTSSKINGGGLQRSMVTSIVVTFSEAVTLPATPADAFQLLRISQPTGGPSVSAPLGAVNLNAVQAGNQVTLTFLAGGVVPLDPGKSLIDGGYQLTILASKVSGAGGQLNGGTNFQTPTAPQNDPNRVFRIFGDADGDGDVDAVNFGQFRSAFGGSDVAFDYDGDGDVDSVDFGQFRQRFGSSV